MVDLERDGYDNLFLVAGYDWYAKLQLSLGPDYQAWDKEATRLVTNFDKHLDKTDPVLVAKWENEVRHACGMKGKPLPVVAKAVKAPVATPAATPASAATTVKNS